MLSDLRVKIDGLVGYNKALLSSFLPNRRYRASRVRVKRRVDAPSRLVTSSYMM